MSSTRPCTIHNYICIHLALPRHVLYMWLGRTRVLLTKPTAQKGAVQISPIQKKLRFLTIKMNGRADRNKKHEKAFLNLLKRFLSRSIVHDIVWVSGWRLLAFLNNKRATSHQRNQVNVHMLKRKQMWATLFAFKECGDLRNVVSTSAFLDLLSIMVSRRNTQTSGPGNHTLAPEVMYPSSYFLVIKYVLF